MPHPLVVGIGAACEIAAREMEVSAAVMDWSVVGDGVRCGQRVL